MVLPMRTRPFLSFFLATLVLPACSNGNGSTGPVGSASAATSTNSTAATPSPAHSSEPGPSISASVTATATATAIPSPSVSATATGTAKVTSTSTAGTASPTGTAVTVNPTSQPSSTATSDPLPAPDPGSADAVAADIDALYAPRKRYKAKFIQKYHQKVQGTDKESHGSVIVERPNKISFRYDAPNQNRIVSDGSVLKVYVADDSQMYQNPVQNTEYPGAFGFIMGQGIRKSFTFTFNDKAKFDAGPVLVGKPREASPAYEAVQFYIDKDKLAKKDLGAVVAVLILDVQGNKNRFEFVTAEEPTTVDSSEFSFTPPAGTTVQQ